MVELGVVAAIAKDVPMYDIFLGVLPFWITFLILIVLIVAFPQISLFLRHRDANGSYSTSASRRPLPAS